MWETAERLGLPVNLDKSNIIVFRNGGHIASCEKWGYGKNVMPVVNQYKYLGIYLSTRLTVSHALNNMAQRAKKGVVGIFKLLRSLGERLSRGLGDVYKRQRCNMAAIPKDNDI